MAGESALAAPPTALDLHSVLALPDDVLRARLMTLIRESGIKFRSRETFEQAGWRGEPAPVFAKFWTSRTGNVTPSRDKLIWDLREPLLRDEALLYCCVLLHRLARPHAVRWIGGMETAAIPVVAGMLVVNQACGGPPLNGFYIRKARKPDGLRRLLEGPRPPWGERVLLVDDILNKGVSKKPLVSYCAHNGLTPSALLVVVNTEQRGAGFFRSICPVESLFTRRDLLGRPGTAPAEAPGNGQGHRLKLARRVTVEPATVTADEADPAALPPPDQMSREDAELVRLARDTVVHAALTGGQLRPTLGEDGHGSPGYSPFLGRYLDEPGIVFTRISKREFKDGRWINRMRGCQAVGLLDPDPGSIAVMTVKSALASARNARKVQSGPAVFHKPVWPGEIGAISLFVYVIERLVPTTAQTADELLEEGHDVADWGLIAQGNGFRGVICSDLPAIGDVAAQIAAACRKMQNQSEIRPHDPREVMFIRMKGRWLWDPSRPKSEFF
jgi:orotate phosphoribosyltransferase